MEMQEALQRIKNRKSSKYGFRFFYLDMAFG